MALKPTKCAIVHHACRTLAHCQTMVSNFKLSSGTVCLPRFAVSISVATHLVQPHKLYNFLFIYDQLCDKTCLSRLP